MNNTPIEIERTYNAPASKIWTALTDRDEMKKWYFDLDAFKAEVGFEFQFYGGKKDGEKFLHLCKVTEVVVGKKLTYSWRYDGFEGNSFVTFELFPEGNTTKLKLTHTGLETFPDHDGAFAKSNFVEGWTHITGISLSKYLEEINAAV
jgi:uncharacterized protein YndB with AHSA1/START domain